MTYKRLDDIDRQEIEYSEINVVDFLTDLKQHKFLHILGGDVLVVSGYPSESATSLLSEISFEHVVSESQSAVFLNFCWPLFEKKYHQEFSLSLKKIPQLLNIFSTHALLDICDFLAISDSNFKINLIELDIKNRTLVIPENISSDHIELLTLKMK